MITSRPAEECFIILSKMCYDTTKQNEIEQNGDDPSIIYSLNKRQMTRIKPTHVGITVHELSELFTYNSYYNETQPCFGQKKPKKSFYGYWINWNKFCDK